MVAKPKARVPPRRGEEGFEEGSKLLVEDVIYAGHANHVQDEHPHSALAEQVEHGFSSDLPLVRAGRS